MEEKWGRGREGENQGNSRIGPLGNANPMRMRGPALLLFLSVSLCRASARRFCAGLGYCLILS